jgi:hypothetical protein
MQVTMKDLFDELSARDMPFTEKDVWRQWTAKKFTPEIEVVIKELFEQKSNPEIKPKSPPKKQAPEKWAKPRDEYVQQTLNLLTINPLPLNQLAEQLGIHRNLAQELTAFMQKHSMIANRRSGESDAIVWCIAGDTRTRPKHKKGESPREVARRLKVRMFYGPPCKRCGSELRHTIGGGCVMCQRSRSNISRKIS